MSAYHCTVDPYKKLDAPCDHSDEKRIAIFGQHTVNETRLKEYYTIPIIDVLAPPKDSLNTHDFALLVLKKPAELGSKIGLICLPTLNEEFGGKKAVAAGWGRTARPEIDEGQSPVLKKVTLEVSKKVYKNKNFIGTKLSRKENVFQDPCSGDSGIG